jgi:hypothetical protein
VAASPFFAINSIYTKNYNDLLFKRYSAQGEKDLEELNSKYIEVNNLIITILVNTKFLSKKIKYKMKELKHNDYFSVSL